MGIHQMDFLSQVNDVGTACQKVTAPAPGQTIASQADLRTYCGDTCGTRLGHGNKIKNQIASSFSCYIVGDCQPPTPTPTASPTAAPTATPTAGPTATPTKAPTAGPTATPTKAPTASPTAKPSPGPTVTPTAIPSVSLTSHPTAAPTAQPTGA